MATPEAAPPDLWANLGVLVATSIAVLAGYFGPRIFGKSPHPEKTVEVAGALVDARSVDKLAVAIEAQTIEMMTARHDAEKGRKIGHELVEAIDRLTGEVEELRRVAGDLRLEIVRRNG